MHSNSNLTSHICFILLPGQQIEERELHWLKQKEKGGKEKKRRNIYIKRWWQEI